MSLTKIALITGGSRGIGAATAILFAELGYNICLSYQADETAARTVVDRISSIGRKAVAVQADVSKQSDVEHLFQQCDDQLGRLLHWLTTPASSQINLDWTPSTSSASIA